ncbi:unnamed protein product, partial [Discosporangium mesarthrocarpum]
MHRKGGARVVVDDMYDWVHVDEKWFYVMKDGRGIYLHSEEDAPKPPRAQNKRFITKVMFLAAVARPRMISNGLWFDGKVGIWPIADTVAAMRSSKNRKKGTMMLKPAAINAERCKELMINKVIPAIKARMPRPPGHTIFVQPDGAKPHTEEGGHGGNSGKGGGQNHPENPACQLTWPQRERSWFLPLHPAAEGGCGSVLLLRIWWGPPWRPSMSTPGRHLNESGRACSQSLGKSLALRVIIATSCPIWERRISVGQA